MTQNGTKLTRKQKRTLAALMTSKSVTQAAETAKVGRSSIYRWMREPGFRQELNRMSDSLLDDAVLTLQLGQADALATLEEILKNPKPDQRRLAAQAWLELTLRWAEQRTLAARLAALEDIYHDNL